MGQDVLWGVWKAEKMGLLDMSTFDSEEYSVRSIRHSFQAIAFWYRARTRFISSIMNNPSTAISMSSVPSSHLHHQRVTPTCPDLNSTRINVRPRRPNRAWHRHLRMYWIISRSMEWVWLLDVMTGCMTRGNSRWEEWSILRWWVEGIRT